MKAKKENKLGSTTDGEGNDLNGKKTNFLLLILTLSLAAGSAAAAD